MTVTRRPPLTPADDPEHPHRVGIHLLGPLVVDGSPELGRRDRIVLSALALDQPRPVSVDRFTEAIWGDHPPASANKVIQGCMSRLRGLLGADAIHTTEHGYALDAAVEVDVRQFERAVHQGREHLSIAQHDRAVWGLSRALDLWRGGPFPDLADTEAGQIEAARLNELRLQAEESRVEAMLATGDPDDALVAAAAMVAAEPLREKRWHQLALAQFRSGHIDEALTAVAECRRVLADELGLDPSPELDELHQALLRRDPSLAVPESQPLSPLCPWPGLASYDADDADGFFGRETELVSALALLRTRGVLVVAGPSGVGKSSFVKAALVPALRRDGHAVATLTPGAHPPDRLPPADVVVVDQAEELFTLCRRDEERARFVTALETQTTNGWLVLAIRADALTEVARHPALARIVERGLYLLNALDETGLRAAIEKPAAQAGLLMEPGLADLLLHELHQEPGAMPLLSHALATTWSRREGRTLTVKGYQESGGVRGAVARSAEDVYAGLTDAERTALRPLMMRLVLAGPEGVPVRTRMPRSLIAGDRVQEHLVAALVDSRLLTTDAGEVTLAHEFVARAWPRLQDWLQDDAEGQRMLHHLASSAESWHELGRPDSELYRGARLVRVTDWIERSGFEPAPTERGFLTESLRRDEDERRTVEEQARQQKRANRRLRALLAGMAVVLAVALVAGLLAVLAGRRATEASRAADARRVGAQAQTTSDAGDSLRLAIAAAALDPSTETHRSLSATLGRFPQLVSTGRVPTEAPLSRVQATSEALFVTDYAHHVWRLGLDPIEPTASYQSGHDQGDMWDVVVEVSEKAGVVAVAAGQPDRHPVQLLDTVSLQPVPDQLPGLPREPVGIGGLDTDAEGRYLAASLTTSEVLSDTIGRIDGGWIMVWDLLAPGRPVVAKFPIEENFHTGVRLSDDGATLFVTNRLAAYDVASERRLWRQDESVWGPLLATQHGGHLLALPDARDDREVALVDDRDGRVVMRLDGHERWLTDVAFSPDGRMVGAVAGDGLALIWDADSGELLHRIEVGGEEVIGLAFSPDGALAYTVVGAATTVQAWDLTGDRSFLTRLPVTDPARVDRGMLRVGRQGDTVAAMDTLDTAVTHLLDVVDDRRVRLPEESEAFIAAADFSPDDSWFAAGFDDGMVRLYDASTGTRLASRQVLDGLVMEVSFAADGEHLVAVDDGGNVVRLEAETLEPLGEMTVPEKAASVAAGPDGRIAFVLAGGTEWRPYWNEWIRSFYLVDLVDGRVLKQGDTGLRNAIYAGFSPNGDLVAAGGTDGEVVILDAESGEAVRPPTRAHDGDVYSVRFSDDGAQLTTASSAHDAAVWDAKTGEVIATTALPATEGVTVSGFRPDGTVLLATFGGGLYAWDPSMAHAQESACRIVGSGLTEDEWELAFPEQEFQPTCPG